MFFWITLTNELHIKTKSNLKDTLFRIVLDNLQKLTRVENQHIIIFLNQPSKWPFFNETFLNNLITLKRIDENKIHFVCIQDFGIKVNNVAYESFLYRLVIEKIYFPAYDIEQTAHQIERNFYNLTNTRKNFDKGVIQKFIIWLEE